MNGKRILFFSINCAVLYGLLLAQAKNSGATSNLLMMITPVLSSGSSTIIDKKIPSLALMAAKDTDKIEIAWVPGSDGKTPVEQIKYEIHLSKTENFTPSAATLKKTVTGTSQTEIQGLESNTFYYGKIIAVYSASSSSPSNQLQSKTYKNPVQLDSSATVAVAADLGLGKYTASGTIYTYTGSGTPPKVGSILFSEDAAGGMTMRTVDSASRSGSAVTVQTSDAALTDAIDRGSISNSFQLFDVAAQAASLPVSSSRIASAQNFASVDGSQHNRMEWKNRLLTAEQTNYAYNEENFSVIPQGRTSVIKLSEANAVEESFTASVEAKFQPTLITEAEWGGFIFKTLDSAKVAAKGTLSLTALAQYNFSASGSVNKDFQLWKRTWVSVYSAGPVPVYQEITLYMNMAASASASAEIEAMAKAQIAETVEVGATYNGVTWTPYITHDESKTLTASLDIAGKANAEIRLIPKIEVKFYKVASASLTVEPLAKSSLTVDKTTSNVEFLAAHPERLVQLTSFDASLGMESNLTVELNILSKTWEVLPSTCVLGTGDCKYTFNELSLFSIPEMNLNAAGSSLIFSVTDGVNNPFNSNSIKWEVFPNDGNITAGSCSKSGKITTCTATFTPGTENEYTVFTSGYGILGEIGRQFKELALPNEGTIPTVTSATGRIWMDRNLGASRVATSMTDTQAYGDLYQWGRGKDGHEKRTSGTTTTLSSTDNPGHGNFITAAAVPYDWRSSQNDNLWQGVSGTNNPCPTGFRVPTADEWQEEMNSWSSKDAAGAFASPLKLVATGFRLYSNSLLNWVDSKGYYWSSTVGGYYSSYLNFGDALAKIYNYSRADGFGVRCIKDAASTSLNEGLVAHYKFEGDANDDSANGNHGIIHGRNSYSTGISGQAISLDGVNDYIELNESISTDYIGISTWFKSGSIKTGIDSAMSLIRLRYFGYRILMNYPTTGSLNFKIFLSDSAAYEKDVNGNYNDNKWHHIVMNYGNVSGFEVYIDGDLVYQKNDTNTNIYNATGGGYSIGKDGNHDSDFFQGEVDEFRIYNRPLSKYEIEYLYNNMK